MERDIDTLKDLTRPSAWVRKAKGWLSGALENRTNVLIFGGIALGVILIGWMLSSRDEEDDTRLPARRESPSLLGRVVMTAIQTFVLYYARKLLVEYLRERTEASPAAAKPESGVPFSQTP